jgi:hypothetical protein
MSFIHSGLWITLAATILTDKATARLDRKLLRAAPFVLATVLGLGIVPSRVHADFVRFEDPGHRFLDLTQSFTFQFDWDLRRTSTAEFGQNWKVKLEDREAAGDSRDLLMFLQHVHGPHPDVDRDPNPANPFLSRFTGLLVDREFRAAKDLKLTHPTTANPHHDYYHVFVRSERPGRSAFLQVGGVHVGEPLPFEWSYRALANGSITVFATYPSHPPLQAIGGIRAVQDGQRVTGQLPKDTRGNAPTDWELTFFGSPATHSTLAFIGEVDDHLEKLEVSPAAELQVGSASFDVPVLSNGVADLFVAIDLVQWLSFPTTFDPLEEITISVGRSELLPGFLVSNSPIAFDPFQGFVTDAPFSGVSSVIGFADGRVVPEPSTLLLLGSGLAGLLGYGWQKWSHKTSRPD